MQPHATIQWKRVCTTCLIDMKHRTSVQQGVINSCDQFVRPCSTRWAFTYECKDMLWPPCPFHSRRRRDLWAPDNRKRKRWTIRRSPLEVFVQLRLDEPLLLLLLSRREVAMQGRLHDLPLPGAVWVVADDHDRRQVPRAQGATLAKQGLVRGEILEGLRGEGAVPRVRHEAGQVGVAGHPIPSPQPCATATRGSRHAAA